MVTSILRRSGLMVAVLALVAAVACSGESSVTPGETGDPNSTMTEGEEGTDTSPTTGTQELVIAAIDEPPGMDNLIDWGAVTGDIAIYNINESLVRWNPDGELEPALAAELPEQLAEDPTRWRVKLREGVSFTNGEPFNAEAVAANVARFAVPEVEAESNVPTELETLEDVEVVDEYTIDFVTSVPDVVFDQRLSYFHLGPPEAMSEEGYGRNPVGTGPYMLESWERGSQFTLSANPDYWGDPPSIESFVVRFIPEESTRRSALQAGDVDLAAAMPPDQASELPQALRSTGVVQSMILRLNIETGSEALSDRNFRLAMNYAVDKQTIIDSIFGGTYSISPCQLFGEQLTGFNDDLEPYSYDPEQAEELLNLADVGDGAVLQLAALATGSSPREREVMQAIQANLGAVGIETEVDFLEIEGYVDAIRQQGTVPDGLLLTPDNAWGGVQRYMDNYYHSEGAFATVGTGFPELDGVIESARSVEDPDSWESQIAEISQIACDEALILYLFDMPDLWGASEGVDYVHQAVGDLNQIDLRRVSVN